MQKKLGWNSILSSFFRQENAIALHTDYRPVISNDIVSAL